MDKVKFIFLLGLWREFVKRLVLWPVMILATRLVKFNANGVMVVTAGSKDSKLSNEIRR